MLFDRRMLPLAATLSVSVFAACSGGGSTPATIPATNVVAAVPTTAPKVTPTVAPTVAPTAAPTAAPTVAPTAVLLTSTLAGAAGFVNAQSRTVYVFDADLLVPGTSACTGQCATVWPSVPATAATTYPAPFAALQRADGTLQLTYAGRPLYTYIADSVAGSIAGNGITSFGAVWHIARPSGVAAPASTTTPVAPTY